MSGMGYFAFFVFTHDFYQWGELKGLANSISV